MNIVPVDQSQLAMQVIELLPKSDLDGVQKLNADKVPQWIVRCLVAGGPLSRPSVTDITVAAPNMPELVPMSHVRFEQLVGRPWDNNGRSGVAFSAAQVRPSHAPKPPAANGATPEPAKVG